MVFKADENWSVEQILKQVEEGELYFDLTFNINNNRSFNIILLVIRALTNKKSSISSTYYKDCCISFYKAIISVFCTMGTWLM